MTSAKRCECMCFAKSVKPDISPVRINNKEIDLISSAKILGLTIRNDLKWNDHVYSIVKKTSKRL
jgi:hypothetical protein